MEITHFRKIKFGEEAPKNLRPIVWDAFGIQWHDSNEEQKIGIVLVSNISYGFYKSKFMIGKVIFGGLESYEIFKTALTELYYKKPTTGEHRLFWNVGDIEIELVDPCLTGEGLLLYRYMPLIKTHEEDLKKGNAEEMKMKVRAAMGDL